MRKIIAIAMVALIALVLFAACSRDGDGQPGAENKQNALQTGESPSADDDDDKSADVVNTEPVADKLPAAEITILFEGSSVSQYDDVAIAANDRLKALGTDITIKPIYGTWDNFNRLATDALSGGDYSVDIVFTSSWTANNYVAYAKRGSFARLDDPDDDLLSKYGTDIKTGVPTVLWNGFRVNGSDGYGVYGVPGYKDYSQMYTWDVNNDRLTELGFSFSDYSWSSDFFFSDEFEAMLSAAKDYYGEDFYPLYVEAMPFSRVVTNTDSDPTGLEVLYLYFNPDNPADPAAPSATNRFDEPLYEQFIRRMHDFFLAGYIDPAAAEADTANVAYVEQQKEALYLIGTQVYSYGYDRDASAARGIDAKFPPASKALISTGTVQGAGYGVNASSRSKAQAVQFLNYWYTDSQLATILAYGIEGTTYEKNSDGTITFIDEARKAYSPWRNGMGNIFILPPTQANGANYWNEFKAYNSAGVLTGYFGFVFDPTPVLDEVEAIRAVMGEYAIGVVAGRDDPDEALPKIRGALEECGISLFVDEFNRQLRVFMATK